MPEDMTGQTKYAPPASLDEARQRLTSLRLEIAEIDAQLHYRAQAQTAIPDPGYDEWRRKALTAMRHRVSTVRSIAAWMRDQHEAAGAIQAQDLLLAAYDALRGVRPDRDVLRLIEAYLDRRAEGAKVV